ncbi:MAG: hypothetical protein DME11_02080, partial [Candidatus Rokuibacteriota bacterium]
VSPVDDFLTATSDTIWDATLQQVAELVQAHRTTLVFAQSRRSAERLARDLNDRITDGRVAAHHGSLSRRARLEAENRLKDGQLKALVATSSLELGIDVGAIDLVVQLQSPLSAWAAPATRSRACRRGASSSPRARSWWRPRRSCGRSTSARSIA